MRLLGEDIIIENERELLKFFNSFGVSKKLKALAQILIKDLKRKKNLKFEFAISNCINCYTYDDVIHIGAPEFLIGKTKSRILMSLEACTAHEASHINETPKEYNELIENFISYFKTKYGIDERASRIAAKYIANGIEDGRIERLLVNEAPGMKDPIIYFRGLWWEIQECTGSNELEDTLFNLCTLATMGVYYQGYVNKYKNKPELIQMIKGVKNLVFEAVDCDNYVESANKIWEIIYSIEDWLVAKLREIKPSELENLENEAKKRQSSGEGSHDEHNSSNDGEVSKCPIKPNEEKGKETKTGEEGKTEENKNPIRAAFSEQSKNNDSNDSVNDESLDKNTPHGDILRDNMPKEDDGHLDTDKSMSQVVKDAMKNAEKNFDDEALKEVYQADFDDMLQKEKEKKEKENFRKNSLNNKEQEKISKMYEKNSWSVNLKYYKKKIQLVSAPESINIQSKKIRRKFQEILLNKTYYMSGCRRGNLDVNSLWKLGIKDYNIFEKKEKPNETDYVFYLLIDGSGSMYGNKYVEAFRAAAILEEVFKNLVPVKIVKFNYGSGHVNHFIVKDYDENKTNKNYSWSFIHNSEASSSNMDGFSIRVATSELLKRPERKKVLIVLSDGLPCGGSAYNGKNSEFDVKMAIREARKNGVAVFNIMFGSEAERESNYEGFKYMYEKGIVSCDPSRIGTNLIKIVQRELK